MTAPNELDEVIVRELNNEVICDGGEYEQEQQSLSSHEDTVSDDIPLSLLSYFETSKCRAALCEELILEGLKDFMASHHTDAITTLPHELDKDMMSLNMQVLCETEPVGNSSSTDTEKELTHSFSVCSNSEGEAETDDCRWCEKCVEVDVRTPKCSMIDEDIMKCGRYEQKLREEQEDMKRKEEERKRSQRNFQDELRKIMEAEELHQKELELMEKRAQEKLEQEFQLQQELIKDLQRQVNEEKKKREEEHERMKEEGEKKKLEEKMKTEEEEEEERRKREAEKNKREIHIMEARKKKEDDDKRKIEEMRLKEKLRRKEEEQRRMEGEERRRVENEEKEGREEKIWIHENMREKPEERKIREIRCRHEKTSRQGEEEEMKRKEGNEEIKEMIRKHEEDTTGEMDKRRKTSEEIGLKEWRARERDDSKNSDELDDGREEEQRMTIEHEVRMKNEFRDLQNQEKKEEEQKVVNEEKKKGQEEKRKREEEEDQRRKKEEEINQREIEVKRKMMGEEEIEKKEDEVEEKMREEEEETTKQEVEKNKMHEDMRKKEAEKLKEIRCREEKTEGWKEEDSEVKLTERNRKCEGHETGTTETVTEEDTGRKSDDETAVKEQAKKNDDDEDKRREEEPRMAIEAEVRTKREKMKEKEKEEERKVALNMIEKMKRKEEENGETEDGNKRNMKIVEERHTECKEERNEEEKATKEKENKQWMEKEQNMEELRPEEERELNKMCEADNREIFQGRKTEDKEKRQEVGKRQKEGDEMRYKDGRSDIEGGEDDVRTEERHLNKDKEERLRLREQKREKDCMKTQITTESLTSQVDNSTTLTSSNPGPSQSPNQSKSSPSSSETVQQDQHHAAVTPHTPLPVCFPEHTEQKRLSWMKDCIPWAKLSLQNKSKQKRSVDSRRRASRASECDSLPPVCPHTVLLSTGCRSLQQVTTVTLEDLPGCCLSTLAQCSHLQSLTLRRCGLKSLEGINHLPNLCCIDVQENDISFVDCGNMTSLRVLQLGHNKLTSIHGLSGAENLHILDLSHNFISRIAGLESVRQLQSLSLGHNQLISTKGLRDVSTLLHLDCSHNHLAVVEGLENNALLHTLDLKSNNITEPPRLINHVLLRELHLDDNSISSLLGLTVCWLPLMQHLSAAQNRITLLPSMSDFVCLANLDLRFNCISELHNVCESVRGCQFLREVHLTGNPLQQESGWRSALQKAVAGLRTIDGKETDSLLSAPAAQQVSLASGSFLSFCQAQLKQTRDLQQQHSKELSNASSPLDAVKCSCRHFSDTLKLAVEQRFAHEYGDTTVSTGQTGVEKTMDMGRVPAEMCAKGSDVPTLEKELPIIQSGDNINCKYLIPEEESTTEKSFHFLTTNETPASFFEMAPESDQRELDSKNTAAAVIQQQWRKYREKCGNISCPPTAEKGGGGVGDRGEPDSGSSNVDRSIVEQDYAATTIQAFWRGFILRRRLASAFAVVTWPDSSEDETFEEVDVDGFVFDEAADEKRWTLSLSEDSSSSGYHHVSEQPLSLKPLRASPASSHYTTPPKQAWVEQVDPTVERTSPESSNRQKSPAAASVLGGLSAESEKIVKEWGFKDSKTALLMLKRAQKMKCKKQQQKIHQDPFVCQQGLVETRNRPAPHRRNHMKVCTAELSPQQAKQMEKVKQERTRQWINFQPDRHSESERFLPEISSDILNGGRVQLVADPGHCEHLHHTNGLWASSSSAAQLSKERNYLRRNSASRPTGKEVPTPERANSAPLKKDRISFRDNPVQLSGGWGGGKKRVKGQVHK